MTALPLFATTLLALAAGAISLVTWSPTPAPVIDIAAVQDFTGVAVIAKRCSPLVLS